MATRTPRPCTDLRAKNLLTRRSRACLPGMAPELPWKTPPRTARSTDLADPTMGSTGFGRNMPLEELWPKPDKARKDPSPREISRDCGPGHLQAGDHSGPGSGLDSIPESARVNHRLCNDGGDGGTDGRVLMPFLSERMTIGSNRINRGS